MFVKFECGCLGLIISQPGAGPERFVLKPCDGEGNNALCFHVRQGMNEKKFEPMDPEQTREVVKRLQAQLGLGDRYAVLIGELRHALGVHDLQQEIKGRIAPASKQE